MNREQEPVVWMVNTQGEEYDYNVFTDLRDAKTAAEACGSIVVPLYAAPVEQQKHDPLAFDFNGILFRASGLTKEQQSISTPLCAAPVAKAQPSFPHCPSCGSSAWFCTVCAAPPQVEQEEPVASKLQSIICEAVTYLNGGDSISASTVLRQDLVDYADNVCKEKLSQKVEYIRVLPDGTVWTRKDDGEMIDTGLVMPTPLGHPTLEYGFEVMRRLGVELAAIREHAAQLEAANEKLAAMDCENARLLGELAATCLKRKEDVRKCERIAAADLDTLVSAGKPGSRTFTARSKVAAEIRATFPEDFKGD